MDMRYLKYVTANNDYYAQPVVERNSKKNYELKLDTTEWHTYEDDHWNYYMNEKSAIPHQGWKIHISSTIEEAQDVLDIVSAFLIDRLVSFKFVKDEFELMYKNSKYGDRGSSGKFIAIYPKDEFQFLELLNGLSNILKNQTPGPYILSDKRWYDSNVYFRYGAFAEMYFYRGAQKVMAIKDLEGNLIEDLREPYYYLPNFIEEPEAIKKMDKEEMQKEDVSSKLDDYEIESAVHFSNGGGVYLANFKKLGNKVIIKEARPQAGLDGRGIDAISRLQQEIKILNQLSEVEGVVNIIEDFQAWEHQFMVEDYIDGIVLHSWLASNYPFSRKQDRSNFTKKIISILKQLIATLKEIHSYGVGIGDLQPNNILITTADEKAIYIDFETASDKSDIAHPGLKTPGFASNQELNREQSDWYAMLKMARYMFLPIGTVEDLSPEMAKLHDSWIESEFGASAKNLIDEVKKECKHRGIENDKSKSGLKPATVDVNYNNIELIIDKLRQGILMKLSEENVPNHQLLPGDIRQYEYDGALYNVATGGFGIALALKRTGGINYSVKKWIEMFMDNKLYTKMNNGLLTGKAGVINVLYELGMEEFAETVLNELSVDVQSEDISLTSGFSGIGLLYISVFLSSKCDKYLNRAIEIAELTENLLNKDIEIVPEDHDGIPLGLVEGWSGASLFLTVLYQVTQNSKWLTLSKRALDNDMMHCKLDEDNSYHLNEDANNRLLPYLSGGSAGVGIAMVAYRNAAKESLWNNELLGIGNVCNAMTYYSPGLFRGASGMALCANLIDYELGMDSFTDKALETIKLYLLEKNGNLYLPGDYCYKLSGDVFSGSSGLLLALQSIKDTQMLNWLPINLQGIQLNREVINS